MKSTVVLGALAAAARAGEDHVARQSLRGSDPAIGWWLRKRVATQIRWASSCVEDASDRAHVLRLAFLREAGLTDDLPLEDRAAVRARFEEESQKGKPRRAMWWGSIVLVVGMASVALPVYLIRRPAAPRFAPQDTPVGAALGPGLTDYVSALYLLRDQRRKGTAATADFVGPRDHILQGVERELGAAGRTVFEDLLQSYRDGVLEGTSYEPLIASVLGANAALRNASRPYLLDVIDDPGAGPILMSHYVARQRVARTEGASIPIYRVQRLDTINRSMAVLGYTRPRLGAALVTLDQLEGKVVTAIAPALVEKGKAHLADLEAEDREEPWVEPLDARAAEVLRREHAPARTPDIDRVIELLARRDQLFWSFRRATASTGLTIPRPNELVSRMPLDVLEGRLPDSELREWRNINDELADEPSRRAFDVLIDRYASAIDRHEVQHQVDFRRGGLVIVPAELRELMRLPETLDIGPDSNAAQCSSELSAYLVSIATAGDHAASAFVHTAEIFFNRPAWVTPHAYAAAIVLTSMARALGIEQKGELRVPGQFDRKRGGELFLAIAERPTPAVADAARAAYTKLFGTPISEVTLEPWQASASWRR